MTGSRSLRRCAACLTDSHLLVIAAIAGLTIVAGLQILTGGSAGQFTGTVCSACASGDQSCYSSCTPDSSSGGGTCSTQPSWPDCQTFSCSNGNWTCTQMKSGSSGTSGSASGCWTCGSCDGMPDGEPKNYCKSGCKSSCDGSSGGYTSGSMMGSCGTGAKGVRYANARYTKNGGSETSGPIYCAGFDTPPCYEGSSSAGAQVNVNSYAGAPTGCDTPASGSTSGTTSGTSGSTGTSGTGGGYVDPNSGKTVKQMCLDSLATITDPAMKTRMEYMCKCGTPPIDASCTASSASAGSTGSTGSTGSMSGERCFFPAKWKKPSGEMFGGTLTCRSDKTDCRETESGPVIASGDIAEFTGGPTSCYGSSGGGSWSSGSTGSYPAAGGNCASGTYNYWSSAKNKSFCVKDRADCDANSEIPAGEKNWCYSAIGYGIGGSQWSTGGGQGYTSDGPREMWINQCVSSKGKSRPECESLCGTSSDCPKSGSYSYWSESKKKWFPLTGAGDCDGLVSRNEIPANEADWCKMATGGGGGGNYGGGQGNTSGAQMPCTFPNGTVLYCRTPNVDCSRTTGGPILSNQEVGATGPNCTFGGGQWSSPGNVDQCVNGCMASFSTESTYYANCKANCHGIGGDNEVVECRSPEPRCDNRYPCPAVMPLPPKRMPRSECLRMGWTIVGEGGGGGGSQWANSQLEDIERRVTEMKAFAEKMASPDLQAIITSITQAINAVRTGTTPEQTRTDGIYELMNKFWNVAQSLRGNDMGQNDGYGYANQCDMIRKKMEYVSDAGAAAQLKDMYGKCIKQMQGAVTGQGYNEQQYSDIQDQFEAYGQQDYAENACAMVDSMINEARNAIENEAPMMIKKLGKKAGAAAKLEKLLGMAKDILNRAYGYRQNNDCGKALTAMRDMEQLGQEADRIMSQAGVRMGGQDLALVDYEQQYDNVTDRVGEKLGKTTNIDMKEFRRHMEKSGYKGAELAAIETLASNPDVLENLLAFAGNSRIVEAAVNADISTVKLESIIAENSALLQKVADLELENKNLKTGVRSIVEQMKNSTYNPRIAPKMAALLEVASSLPEKDFKAKYEQYVQESNNENYKTGIDPFRDVHTFEKGHEWFIAAVKEGVDSGLFKGNEDGTFAPEASANVAQVVTVFARSLGVEEGSEAQSAYAQKMPAYAQEPAGGLEDLDIDLTEIFTGGAPGDAATRLQVARMIAASYGDMLPEADETVLSGCTDSNSLTAEDRKIVALAATNGIMTCVNGAFDPKGKFNRAQFATVMNRITEATSADLESGEEESGDATAVHTAAYGTSGEADEDMHAAAEESSSAAPRAPDFISDQISEQQLQMLTALVASFVSQNGKLGVTKEQALRVSLMTEVSKSLASTQAEKFDRWRKQENMPNEWIAKQTVNLENMMTPESLTMLREEIIPASGFLMQ